MKNIKYPIVLALLLMMTGCQKFLNVTPIDALSGNNFWKSRQDVEAFTNGIYARLKSKVGGGMLIPAIEMRSNFVGIQSLDDNSSPIINLIGNNLRPVKTAETGYDRRLQEIMRWKAWYDIIASCNILYYELDNVPATAMSDAEKKRYKAEAVFLRNLSYMFLCKLFGDVIYYTDAYNTKALGRMPQVEVMNRCLADMGAAKLDLPIAYSDGSLVGVRPTRASAVALMMHLNMWAAAWESTNKDPYYTNVLTLAEELATYNTYFILPKSIENTKAIFKGRSQENLFTVLQDFNYRETFARQANYAFFFSHWPLQRTITSITSHMYYEEKYMNKLFPEGVPDVRRSLWFENIAVSNGNFQFKKFINYYATGSGPDLTAYSDDSAVIFRVSDAILLAAQAAAELDQDQLARDYVNKVREASSATFFTSGGEELKDDIYEERCRELIGEGHFFFDLVRTKRAVNPDYSKGLITVGDFNNGAWTWPLLITAEDRNANPKLVDNTFWN